jgi:hypothetical protein
MSPTAILSLISNFFSAGASYFGYAKQRDAEKNAPAIQQAANAAQEQSQADKTNKAIAASDTDELRKELAE